MRVFWQLIAKLSQAETRLIASILMIAALLLAFGLLAEEVIEGETLPFDQKLMLALREAGNPGVPIGPPWLPEAERHLGSRQHDRARDPIACRGGLSASDAKASRSVADAGRGIKRRGIEQLAEIRFRAVEA
jgi:hypothetical protein